MYFSSSQLPTAHQEGLILITFTWELLKFCKKFFEDSTSLLKKADETVTPQV